MIGPPTRDSCSSTPFYHPFPRLDSLAAPKCVYTAWQPDLPLAALLPQGVRGACPRGRPHSIFSFSSLLIWNCMEYAQDLPTFVLSWCAFYPADSYSLSRSGAARCSTPSSSFSPPSLPGCQAACPPLVVRTPAAACTPQGVPGSCPPGAFSTLPCLGSASNKAAPLAQFCIPCLLIVPRDVQVARRAACGYISAWCAPSPTRQWGLRVFASPTPCLRHL